MRCASALIARAGPADTEDVCGPGNQLGPETPSTTSDEPVGALVVLDGVLARSGGARVQSGSASSWFVLAGAARCGRLPVKRWGAFRSGLAGVRGCGQAYRLGMAKSRRIASAHPPTGGAARSWGGGLQLAARARELTQALLDGFKRHDLLTYSSAISFQILTAIIPFALFVLAVAGLLHLNSVWRDHLEPQIQAKVSDAVFTVISNAVTTVFAGGQWLWATVGGGLALWQVSGAVRAVMGALGRIYGAPTERPFFKRYLISFALSIEVGACFILATLCLLLAPFFSVAHAGVAWEVFAFLVRWALAAGFLWLAVGLLVRHAPATAQSLPWVSLGAAIVVGLWLIVSLVFYVYLTTIASYESAFGSLATVIVMMAYLYISTTVFLFGTQLDAIIRAQATGALSGSELVLRGRWKRS
jgi:membrane protein